MVTAAVVGSTGYVGAELVSLLAVHPEVRLVSIHAETSAGKRFEDLYPSRAHLYRGTVLAFDPERLDGLDVVFLAQPQGESARAAAQLAGRVGAIIDLGGDLRLLDAETYRNWYGKEHPAPALLGTAAYGLPELFGDELPKADLVACAGCYATVAQLAAAPALAHGEAIAGDIVIAAVSGTTGAGRKAQLDTSFSEVGGNLRAYRVGNHQHVPEIRHGLERHTGRRVTVTFVPHLGPFNRGIFASVVLRNLGELTQAEVLALYRESYGETPLVRVVDPALRLPQVSDVVGTPFCDLAPVVDEQAGTIVVLGVIDNLLKGAASQAVQVLNLVHGLPETLGLLPAAQGVTSHVYDDVRG